MIWKFVAKDTEDGEDGRYRDLGIRVVMMLIRIMMIKTETR